MHGTSRIIYILEYNPENFMNIITRKWSLCFIHSETAHIKLSITVLFIVNIPGQNLSERQSALMRP